MCKLINVRTWKWIRNFNYQTVGISFSLNPLFWANIFAAWVQADLTFSPYRRAHFGGEERRKNGMPSVLWWIQRHIFRSERERKEREFKRKCLLKSIWLCNNYCDRTHLFCIYFQFVNRIFSALNKFKRFGSFSPLSSGLRHLFPSLSRPSSTCWRNCSE